MSDEQEGPPATGRHAFSTYTALSLASPTLIGTVLCLIDHPTATWAWAGVVLGILAIGAQQIGWLVRSGLWSGSASPWLRLPAALTGAPALLAGVGIGWGIEAYGISGGRPAYLWVIPGAAAIGVLALSLTRWDREMPRWSRGAMALVVALILVMAVVGEWAALAHQADAVPAPVGNQAANVLVIAALVMIVQVGQVWWDRVVTELITAREALVDLTLTEERQRFAGELHDLQGHELQVIMLRADLGQALLRAGGPTATDDAARTFEEIRDAAQQTLQQTREIAHGYRKTDLAQEVANTQPILAAAGITVQVEGPVGDIDGDEAHLAGLLVREATTNVLRHSTTDQVRIEVKHVQDGYAVTILDVGPRRARTGTEATPGSGLSSLAERAQRLGYRVSSGPQGEGWLVTLAPAPRPRETEPAS